MVMKRGKKGRCPVCGARIRNGRCVWCGEKEVRDEIPIDVSVLSLEQVLPSGKDARDAAPAPFFWEKRTFCILLLVTCFPAGMILMYSYGHFRAWQRTLISSLIILLLLSSLLLFIPSSPFNVRFDLMPSGDDAVHGTGIISPKEDIDETVLRLVRDEALSRRNAIRELVRLGWDEDEAASAVDASGADFFFNALVSAEWCTGALAMSRAAAYEQLTSVYGEGFTPEEASYALLALDADFFLNAHVRAVHYRDIGKTGEETLRLLTGEWGEGFSRDEAISAVEKAYSSGM